MHRIDPASLPVTTGQVERFTLNPHGELDGLVLAEGKLVHFPPHLLEAVAAAVRLGDKISVHDGMSPANTGRMARQSRTTTLTSTDGRRCGGRGETRPRCCTS